MADRIEKGSKREVTAISEESLVTAPASLARIRLLTRMASGSVIVWSLLVVIGQGLYPATFTRLVPSTLAMNVMNAMGFFMGGGSLLLDTYLDTLDSRQTAARIGGGILVLWGVGCWAVSGGLFSPATELDSSVVAQGIQPSIPIPTACAVLLCLGFAILTLPIRTASGHRPSQYFAGALLLVGAITGMGFLYGISVLFDSPRYDPIDASSAIICVLMGLALLSLHPTEGFMRMLTSSELGSALLRRLAPVAIGLPIVIGWLGILGQRQHWYELDLGVALVMGAVMLILLAGLWYLADWASQVSQTHYRLVQGWREQEAKLQLAASAARIGYWRWTHSKNCIEIDQVAAELLDVPPDSPITLGSLIKALAQENRREFVQTFHNARQTGQSFELECRPASTACAHWISIRGFPLKDTMTSSCVQGVVIDVSERRQTQRALEESQQRLNIILQSAMDAIITIDQDQHILLFNGAAEKLFRCSSAEAIGKPISRFIPEQFRHRHHSHIMTFQEGVVTARQMGRPGAVRALRADGQEFPIEASISRVAIGELTMCTVILRDITDRVEREEAIRESEARFRNMADSAPVMMLVTDSGGNCRYLNRQWYGFTGHRKETGLEAWLNHVHEEDRPRVTELIQYDGGGEVHRLECRMWRHDGEVRWTLWSLLSIVDERGIQQGCIGSIVDIMDSKQAEHLLKRSADELERQVVERTAALRNSQERLRALTNQLTRTEHQERRRIAAELHDYLAQLLVAAHLKLAQDTRPIKTKQDKALAKDLERILDEALTYTRSLVAKLSPPVLYHLGLPQALQWLAEQMTEEHQLVVETAFDLPSSFSKLPDDMATILFQSVRELLFNVLKHAGTFQAQIALRTTPDQQLVIVVTDQGHGFNSSLLDQPSTIPASFGLFSIKERMEGLGGSIHINSRIGQGTSVTLLCPLPSPQPASTLSPPSSTEDKGSIDLAPQPLRSLRIMLVDDHAMVRQGIRALLEQHPNVEVVGEAWDGQQACELVSEVSPDVIVMDANMPRLDGIEATRRIKKAHPQIVIIGLSVQTATPVATSMLQAGASGYLTKESAGQQLYETILTATMHGNQSSR